MSHELQYFKDTDEKERQWADFFVAGPLAFIGTERDAFYNGAYTCYQLGNVLFQLNRSPFAGIIPQEAFIRSFPVIHQFFTRPGTFEYYLEVFRTIWGADVDVEFVIPNPGHLEINIDALTIQLQDALVRRIVDNEYEYHELVDHNGDNIALSVQSGIKTQREVDALMRELAPAGLLVETTLTIS